MAVLLCAMMDAEQVRIMGSKEWRREDNHTDIVDRLTIHVGGFAVTPRTMCALLLQQLHRAASPLVAVTRLISTVLRAASDQHASTLRVMMLLESRLVQDQAL